MSSRHLLALTIVAALPGSTLIMPSPIDAAVPAAFKPLTWDDLIKRPRPKPDATISYGSDTMQKVDVWLPRGKGPFPTVLMVHGGCWTTGIADRTLMNWVADDLRRSGVAVWNIDYRGVDRAGGGYPGTFSDAAKAADQLLVSAAKFNLDIKRIVAVGHSAGGHLALWLAARGKLPADSPLRMPHPLHIDHVTSLGGLPDLEATATSPDNGCGTAVVAKLVGQGRADPYADTSVTRLLPLGVAQELVNGREDRIIPYRMATDYVARATAAGDRVSLHTVPNTGHVELVMPDTAAWRETKRLLLGQLRVPDRQLDTAR
ncbi:alpha/beta hydrolase [Sphingomonas sp. Mn802worker]|uniref:alpha/beta hydrolase n=1 Tax=Sphingomonas sp. Mn802worker TaxID=629773 RepID=UPI0003644128|nr:alpha/beta hydrolase [Sphingomonas sp. Mn802worker]